MIKLKFSIRAFIKPDTGKVAIRVRWNSKACETTFITGVYAEPEKWDDDTQKAKKGTTHHVRKMTFTASEINERISDFKQEIETSMETFSLQNKVPTTQELKDMVNRNLGRVEEIVETKVQRKRTLKQLFDEFLVTCGREKNWDDDCKEKYVQAYHHFTAANPHLPVDKIDIEAMYNLRDWYIENKYKNRTINKQTTMLKCFLRWINQQDGYSIPDSVLNFATNLKVMRRTVTFLHYDELLYFSTFQFENDHERLSRARDMFCFMAFTSLRYSDLSNLKTGHINDNRIDMMTQKTSDHISIPLTDGALNILNRYKGKETADGRVFDVPSNQKLNDAIKDAAKAAGINRVIVDTYIIGTERKEEQHEFCDIISCHDARRTFVSCSLAMGIPPQVVMKCTGHKGYNTMKPYIETATETQALEMEKWNRSQYRSQIITLLDSASENHLKKILEYIKRHGVKDVKNDKQESSNRLKRCTFAAYEKSNIQ